LHLFYPLKKPFQWVKFALRHRATIGMSQVVVVVERSRNMNIQAAAEFLGVSVKSIERQVKSKKIAVTYIEGKRDFTLVELTRFKEQKQEPVYRPALATSSDMALSQVVAPEYLGEALKYLEMLAHSAQSVDRNYQLAAIHSKKLIDLSEAEAISGLSKNFLRFHLKSGELQGQKLGRGWKIRPSDLEKFIDGFFD
jgi:hypothetical protein